MTIETDRICEIDRMGTMELVVRTTEREKEREREK